MLLGTPSYAETNMGPRYSNMNAAQYLLKHGAKSLVIASPSTLSAYADGFIPKMAKARGRSVQDLPDGAAGHGCELAAHLDDPGGR